MGHRHRYARFRGSVRELPTSIVDTRQVTVGLYRLEKTGDRGNWVEIGGTAGPRSQPGAFDSLNGTDGTDLVYSRFGERS